MKLRRIREHYQVKPGYWFAPKMFGWGASPVTWQGWLATFVYAVAMLLAVRLMPGDYLKLAAAVPITLAFVLLVWRKTEGGFHWHWGPRER